MTISVAFESGRIAEASQDATIELIPTGPGPNEGVGIVIRSASERGFKLGLAGDHIMAANNVGPVAVAHTEAKPSGSFGGIAPREGRRVSEHFGGWLRSFDQVWTISRPGLPVDVYKFEGCIFTGDWGEERNAGSLPVTAGEFLITRPYLNGKDLLRDPSQDNPVVALISAIVP